MSPLLAVALGNTTASAALASDEGLGDVLRVPIGRLENLKEILSVTEEGIAEEGVPVVVASVNPREARYSRPGSPSLGCWSVFR